MKRTDPETRLLIRAVIVLTVVVLLCRVSVADEHAIAGELADVLTSESDLDTAAEEIVRYASTGSIEAITDPGVPSGTVSDMNVQAGSDDETQETETGTEAQQEPDIDDDTTTEPIIMTGEDDTADDTEAEEVIRDPFYGMSDAEIRAYKQTQEYIDTLLVTSSEYYDGEVVGRATAIPMDDNDARYCYLMQTDYVAYTVGNMPDGYKNSKQAKDRMVTIDVPVWLIGSDGVKYSASREITIHAGLADSVRCIFSDIYLLDEQFPIDDIKGYNYRKVSGMGLADLKYMSMHSFGAAIDINYNDSENDLYAGPGNDLRDPSEPYYITEAVIDIFRSYGWFWGGDFDICTDTAHFQYLGLEFLQYADSEPFPILKWGLSSMDPKVVKNLQQRLVELGYLGKVYTAYNATVDAAVRNFQFDHDLPIDGVVDHKMWVLLLNETHYMESVF